LADVIGAHQVERALAWRVERPLTQSLWSIQDDRGELGDRATSRSG